MIWIVLSSLLIPFGLSAGATGAVRRWAIRTGFVDRPGGRKGHDRLVALGGGIAIVWAVVVPVVCGLLLILLIDDGTLSRLLPQAVAPHFDGVRAKAPSAIAVMAGAVVLHVLGLVDDRRALGPWVKLTVQGAVALAMSLGVGIRLLEMLGPVPAVVLSAVWIVAITNAFNFLDNMDGLCAGVAVIAGAILAGAAVFAGQLFVPVLALVFVGAVGGFLAHNFPPASIFMGDAGSLPIGFLLAILTILTTFYDPDAGTTPFGVLVPLVVLAVPLYDSASVVLIRLRSGQSILSGDRRHFSHRLLRRGLGTRAAVLTIYLATAATGLAAVLLPMASWPLAVLVLTQTSCVVGMIAVLEFGRRDRAAP
jgi:UDP-GlcNAc:undecaprenyl-phosphate GlcNAc-1-phosphate transferase